MLRLARRLDIAVGRLGVLRFQPGHYVYVGSAFGPGGLRARVSRHWVGAGRRHWHVDYLRARAQPVAAWVQVQQQAREHEWSHALAAGRGLVPVPGFGCTDCTCPSHLYFSRDVPSFRAFRRRLGRRARGDGALLNL